MNLHAPAQGDDDASGFEREMVGRGVRYRLPPIGSSMGAKVVGAFFLLFGIGFSIGMIYWIYASLGEGLGAETGSSVISMIFALMGVPGLLAGLAAIGLGLFMLFGREWIEIGNGEFRDTFRLGFFSWRRTRPSDAIEKLTIVNPMNADALAESQLDEYGRGRGDNEGERPSAIRISGEGMKPMAVAYGLSRPQLLALADDLSQQLATPGRSRLFASERRSVAVEVEEAPAAGVGPEASPPSEDERPPWSRTGIERREDGLTITVPSMGLWGGTKGMFPFSIIWNVIIVVFFSTALSGNWEGQDAPPVLFLALFAIPFVLVGIVTLVISINMGKRRAILDVIGDHLLITRQNIFGTKQREFTVDQVTAIRVGPSGMKVNDRPVFELQIHGRNGKELGMLGQLPDDELEYIAKHLRYALQVPSQ